MNRAEAMKVLRGINAPRASVNADFKAVGFFFSDAVKALGGYEPADRHIAALTRAGAVRCTKVQVGGTWHDFYTTVTPS